MGELRFYLSRLLKNGITLALICGCVMSLQAQSRTLLEIADHQGFALGNATAGRAMGMSSAFRNPAGLVAVNKKTFSTTYGSVFENLYQHAAGSFAMPREDGSVIGLTGAARYISDIPLTVSQGGRGVLLGSDSDTQFVGMMTWAKPLSANLSVGTQLSYFTHRLFSTSMTRFSLGFGALYDRDWVSVGASAMNLGGNTISWSTGREETAKSWYTLGAAFPVAENWTLMTDSQFEPKSITKFNGGVEYKISSALSLQGGIYDITKSADIRIGTTLTLKGLDFQYTMGLSSDLGNTQEFGVKLDV